MVISILAFGIAKDIVGNKKIALRTDEDLNVGKLKDMLLLKYKKLNSIPSLLIAVNLTYAKDTKKIKPGDEIALIPPTNGG